MKSRMIIHEARCDMDLWIPNSLLAQKIREVRRRLGLTQDQLAERLKLGKGQGDVSKWESGKARPSKDHLVALAAMLNEDPLVLFAGRDVKGYKAGLRSAVARLRGVLDEMEKEINDEPEVIDIRPVDDSQ